VIVTGFVEKLEETYANCSFTICPVLWGGGSNIKVLECLFHRRTSVVSSRAAQSHSDILVDGIDYLVAKSEKDFVACCLRLIRDPSLADGLAEHGESQVTKMRSKEIFQSIIHAAIKQTPSE
jgi:glycosyltransferase involved in cell wall biosynthesis